jgi:hypothetical protein
VQQELCKYKILHAMQRVWYYRADRSWYAFVYCINTLDRLGQYNPNDQVLL